MMKITGAKTELPAVLLSRASDNLANQDLLQKPNKSRKQFTRRKCRGPRNGVRLRKEAGVKKSSRPETPLLPWKITEGGANSGVNKENEESLLPEDGRKVKTVVSARKLGAGIWRMQLPEVPTAAGEKFGVQSRDNHVGVPIHGYHNCRLQSSDPKDVLQSPYFVSGPREGHCLKTEPMHQLPNLSMEGATKWDPVDLKTSDKTKQNSGLQNLRQEASALKISTLETELEQARARIQELENERQSAKKKLERFLKKLSEERAAWRSREHEKVRAIIDDMKGEVRRERKNCQRIEILNSRLVNELAEAESSAKRYMQDFEKERKARELIEDVCDELAREIGEDKAEVEALKSESLKFREEADEERKMLQMAEVWREERVQMKLIDAKVALEERYSLMNTLIADLESFLSSKGRIHDSKELRKAELLRKAAQSINIKDIKEFTYEPPNSDDLFSVFEDINYGDQNEKQIEPCLCYSPASHASKVYTVIQRHSHPYVDRSGNLEEEGSDWETVSQAEDQGSCYSPDGSDMSVDRIKRDKNVSRGRVQEEGVADDQGTPITEINEVCSVPSKQVKKGSSVSRLWRSRPSNGDNCKIISVVGVNGKSLSNGRLSNAAVISPARSSCKGGQSPIDFAGQWSSPDTGNPHIAKGMKGCIEWPRNTQKTYLKSKLLEAQMDTQKIQLRHVLKQKI